MLRIANHYVSRLTSILLMLEFIVSVGAVYLGASLRLIGSAETFQSVNQQFFLTACVIGLIIVFSMAVLGMYQISSRESIRKIFLRLMPSLVLALALTTLIFYIFPSFFLGRGVVGLIFFVAAIGILVVRAAAFKTTQSGLLRTRIIFLGTGVLARGCHEFAVNKNGNHEFDIVGFVGSVEEEGVPSGFVLPLNLGIVELVKKFNVNEIVVAVQNRRSEQFPLKELLDCKLMGISVIDASAFIEREACQICVKSVQPGWLVFGNGFDQSFFRRFGKATFDFFVSAIIFALSLPLMLITAIAIYLEDRGPIFYKQERVGKYGKTFFVLKFRSMGMNAEKSGVPQWASNDDPRTTKVGKFIRKLRIDELPQIINVLRGEMSFVGPRPERPFFVEKLCKEIPFYNMRHSIKPGITGLAQVRYAYGASVADAIKKLQFDLYYVKNNSLFLDILILIETIQVVLLGKGAR